MHEQTTISNSLDFTAATSQANVNHSHKIDIFSESAFINSIPIQCKLNIGATDDPLEQEADEMADKVMLKSEGAIIQRYCNHCLEEEPEQIQRNHSQGSNSFLQRKCSQCEEEQIMQKPLDSFIQMKESSGKHVATNEVTSQILSNRGNGNSLDRSTKEFMETRMGASFEDVKIHTGAKSIQMNRDLNAKAFTVGRDIYFNESMYQPQTDQGKWLLAHELTHTIQQQAVPAIQKKGATEEQFYTIVKVILRPGENKQGTLTFITNDGKSIELHASYQGDPNPGIYRYDNGELPDEEDKRMGGTSTEIDGKNWITRYKWLDSMGKHIKVANYEFQVIDKRLFSENGFLALSNVQLGELSELTEGFTDYDFRVLTKYRKGKLALNFEDAKNRLIEFQREKLEFEEFQLSEASIESKLYNLAATYNLYKVYTCQKSIGSGAFSPRICAALADNIDYDSLQNPDNVKQELEADLIKNGFASSDPIAEFETYITKFTENYERLSMDITLRALDQSQSIAEAELKRYTKTTDEKSIYDKLSTARSLYEDANDQKNLAKLTLVSGNPLAYETFNEQAAALDEKSEAEYRKHIGDYPVLSTFNKDDILDEDKDFFSSNDFIESIADKIYSIKRAREEIIKNPNYIYKLGELKNMIYQNRGIETGSILDLIVKDKTKAIEDDESILSTILLVVSIVLIPFTLGGSGLVALTATAGMAAIGTYSAIEALDKYAIDSLFYDAGLIADKPSVFWVAVAVAGAGLDMAAAATVFSKFATIAKKYPSLSTDLVKCVDEIEASTVLSKGEGLAADIIATEQKIKASLIKQAKVQQELDIAFEEARKRISSGMFSNPFFDPANIKAVADLAYLTAKRGYYHFEEFLLMLKRSHAIDDIDNLAADELQALKKAYQEGIGASQVELRARRELSEFGQQADEFADEAADTVRYSFQDIATLRQRSGTMAKGKIGYGNSDLSEIAKAFRKSNKGITTKRNIAVAEYLDVDGTIKTVVRSSSRGHGHSERLVGEFLEFSDISPKRLLRIFTERQPCSGGGGYCARFMGNIYPETLITWSVDAGEDATKILTEILK